MVLVSTQSPWTHLETCAEAASREGINRLICCYDYWLAWVNVFIDGFYHICSIAHSSWSCYWFCDKRQKMVICLKYSIRSSGKYAKKLIRCLTSSGSAANFNSHSLGCTDKDPSKKNEYGSMSEETGGSGFSETTFVLHAHLVGYSLDLSKFMTRS